ncbi:unnamed protein product [Pylaiella littoralis]
MLLQGAVYGLPGSDGKRWSNFREWAKNQHPVLSMFFAHELHPFSRTERFSVLLCYLCWAFFITCVFEQQTNKDNQQICDGECEHTYIDGTTLEEMCASSNVSVSLEDYNSACDGVMPWFVLSFTIAACTVPYSTILKILATCGCVQALPNCVKNCFELLGAMVLGIFGCLSLVWLGVGITISLTLDGGMFMVVYLLGVAKSWMYWPLIAGVVFLCKYRKEKRRFEEQHAGQVAMAWPIDADLEIKIGHDGKPVAYQSPQGSPKRGGEGGLRKGIAITAQPGSPRMTPDATPSPQRPCDQNGGYPRPPEQHHEQQYRHLPSAAVNFPTSPPRPPAENPYLNYKPNRGVQGEPGLSPSYVSNGHKHQSPRAHLPYGERAAVVHGSPPADVGAAAGGGDGALPPDLPYGWESKVLPEGRTLFIDHNTETTHWEPPTMQQRPATLPSYLEHQALRAQQLHPSSPPSYQQHETIRKNQLQH